MRELASWDGDKQSNSPAFCYFFVWFVGSSSEPFLFLVCPCLPYAHAEIQKQAAAEPQTLLEALQQSSTTFLTYRRSILQFALFLCCAVSSHFSEFHSVFLMEIGWKDQPHGTGTFVNEQGEYVVISSVPHGHHNRTCLTSNSALRIVNFKRENSFRQSMVALSGGRAENVKSATCVQSRSFTIKSILRNPDPSN